MTKISRTPLIELPSFTFSRNVPDTLCLPPFPLHTHTHTHTHSHAYTHTQGYYKRTPEYLPILQGKKVGCLRVPVVHSAVLIDLKRRRSELLSYWPALDGFIGPTDEVTHFAYSAKLAGMFYRHICCSPVQLRVHCCHR